MNTQANSVNCDNLASSSPVSTGLISGIRSAIKRRFSKGLARWIAYNKYLINRRAFQTMLKLDDATLKDIGVTRSDVLWANKLPLSTNAAEELNRISLIRRRKEWQG